MTASKFKTRYGTVSFDDVATLDDADRFGLVEANLDAALLPEARALAPDHTA